MSVVRWQPVVVVVKEEVRSNHNAYLNLTKFKSLNQIKLSVYKTCCWYVATVNQTIQSFSYDDVLG